MLVFSANIAANLFTVYGLRLSDNDQKYLLPLYSSLPVFFGIFISACHQKSRFVGFILLGFVLFINVFESFRHEGWLIFSPARYQEYREGEERKNLLAEFLKKNGLTRVYDQSGLGKEINFRSGGALVFASPFQENVLKQADLVDGSWRLAWLGDDPSFEAQMKSIGGRYRKVSVPGGFNLYTDFQPPPCRRPAIPESLDRQLQSPFSKSQPGL